MCCATRIGQGKSAGSGVSSASRAGGPPVEAPTSTRPSPLAAVDRRRRSSALGRRFGAGAPPPMRWRTRSFSRRLDLSLAPAAARTLATSSGASRPCAAKPPRSGFGDEVDRAQPQGLQRRLRAFRGQRRDHHHRAGPLDHDAVEAGQAVHLRHVDVEGDDVGLEAGELAQRLQPVARELHLEVGFAGEHLAEQLPHQGGIVDHQQLDHPAPASPPRLERVEQAALGAAQQFGRVEHQDDPAGSLQVDHAAAPGGSARR